MDGYESQNDVYKLGSLTLLVTSAVVNVVSGTGLPVESSLCFGSGLPVESDCETKIISRPTDHQWSILTFRTNGVARWRV